MKKKIIIIVIVLLVLAALGTVGYFYFKNAEIKILKTEINYEEEITSRDLIQVKKGLIASCDKINTKVLGHQQIVYKISNSFGRKYSYTLDVSVVDKEQPTIKVSDIVITAGEKIDLKKYAILKDNYDKHLEVDVIGTYDLNKAGEYELTYATEDSSGNKASATVKLTVKAKPTVDKSNATFTTTNGFSGVTKNGITTIDGIVVVNKTYSVPKNYGDGLTKQTQDAFNEMKAAAAKDGINIYIVSGYRSFDTQNTLYNNYVKRDGKTAADRYSARPGHSEHQTGLAFDLNSASSKFDNTKEAKWLAAHCFEYGFILRYPKGKEKITGYMYESWHFRFVGEELAAKLYNKGNWTTLEEYFGITSSY